MYYKNIVIIFLNKAVFIFKNVKFVISIFCAINIIIDVTYYFKISRVLDFVLTAFSTVNNVMLRELNFGNYFVRFRERILIL